MPISNITQIISAIPNPPHRGVDVQTIFVNKQEDFQDHLTDITVTELNTLKDQLNSRIGEINSTTTTMNGYANTASAGASTATTKAGEASTSATAALASKNQASTFATNSSNSATKASQWADNNYNVEVETGKYSAKHWSTVAQNATANKVDKVTSTDNAIVRFDGTTGAVQNSAITIDDNGNIGTGTQSFNGFGGSGSKNMLINSGFTRWSKGESFNSIANETYAADNWKIGTTGTSPTVYKGGQVFQIGTNSLAIDGANGNTNILLRQYIEDKNCRKLYSGKKVTISFDIYTNSSVPANKVISINMDRPAGANDWTSSYEGIGSSVTIQPNTATRRSVTLTIPSDYYKWGTRLIVTIDKGLQSGQTIAIGNIQMEEGSIASPYEQKTEQKEIEENSRYIQKIDSPYSSYTVFCVVANNTTTQFIGCLKLPYPMYGLPSGTAYGNFQIEGLGAVSSVYVEIHNSRDRVLIKGTTGTTTVGRAGTLLGNNDSTASFLLTSYLG